MSSLKAKEDLPLLKYLLKHFPDKNRTKIKQYLKYGSIFVNNKPITKHDFLVKTGDEILFRKAPVKPVKKSTPKAQAPFLILYEEVAAYSRAYCW